MRDLHGGEISPGSSLKSDRDLDAFIRQHVVSSYHPCGTCRMGQDPMAVVDPECRVHGVEGLRVADASIMPLIPSCNLNCPTIMIGREGRRSDRGPPAAAAFEPAVLRGPGVEDAAEIDRRLWIARRTRLGLETPRASPNIPPCGTAPRGESVHGPFGQVGHRHRRRAGHRARVRAAIRDDDGAKVVIADIQSEKGEAAAQSLRDAGGEATFVACDVGRPRAGRGAGREDGRGPRRPRRDDQQRRGAPSRRRARAGGRGLRPGGAGEPQGVLPHRPGRGEADGRAGPRRGDHPHVVDPGVHHQCEPARPTRCARAG